MNNCSNIRGKRGWIVYIPEQSGLFEDSNFSGK